jgi:hypothetical protein
VITIYNTNLTNVFKWLDEEMDLKIGQDWHWTWNRVENRPGVEFADPRTEMLIQLKATNL